MASNYYNEHCWQCSVLVYKGTGTRIFVNPGGWVTMCLPCGESRKSNKKKAAQKRAAIKRMPTLFD